VSAATDPVELHVVEEGAGRPVVLLHGWSFSAEALAPQRAALARIARVLAVDLRGHGASPAPEAGYDVDGAAGDVAALLERRSLDGVVLVGWSWGGEVALAALAAARPRVAALALLSATPRFTAAPDWPHGLPEANVRALSRRLARDLEGTRRLFVEGMLADGEVPPAERAALVDRLLATAPPLHAARATLDALARADLRARVAAAAHLPALVVHGERDAVCLPGAARWLAGALPRARLALLPGAGHAPHLTRAAEVNALLAGLVEALP
jgi:pimeloyl-[acyl-carrier protein] methyl ester esterase